MVPGSEGRRLGAHATPWNRSPLPPAEQKQQSHGCVKADSSHEKGSRPPLGQAAEGPSRGSGFRFGSRIRVFCSQFRVHGSGFPVGVLKLRVQGFRGWVPGFRGSGVQGFRVQSSGFRVFRVQCLWGSVSLGHREGKVPPGEGPHSCSSRAKYHLRINRPELEAIFSDTDQRLWDCPCNIVNVRLDTLPLSSGGLGLKSAAKWLLLG